MLFGFFLNNEKQTNKNVGLTSDSSLIFKMIQKVSESRFSIFKEKYYE